MASIFLSPTLIGGAFAIVMLLTGMLGIVIAANTGPRARLRQRMAQIAGTKDADIGRKGDSSLRRSSHTIRTKLAEAGGQGRTTNRRIELRLRIERAGLTIQVKTFYILSVVAAALGTLIYLLTGFPWYFFPAATIVAGVGLPRKVLTMLATRRQKHFTQHFADSLDVIVRGIRSGLPVGECLNMIAREAPEPVCGEFRLMVEGQRLGMTLKQALEHNCRRMPTADMKFFAIVLNLQQQTGGNLAETLAGLSDVLRGRKRMADKVRAMSSEARMTSQIIGSMPIVIALGLYALRPEYISKLWTPHPGYIVYIGASMMISGIFIIKKMISFEI